MQTRRTNIAVSLAACLISLSALAQCNSGLYAGLTAKVNHSPTSESIALQFVVLNDSDLPLDVGAASWTIVVDGTPLRDSGMLFGNGPGPIGGFKTLKPGETYQFGKSLSIAQYFSGPGKHTVSWKADGFKSRTVTVVIERLGNKF